MQIKNQILVTLVVLVQAQRSSGLSDAFESWALSLVPMQFAAAYQFTVTDQVNSKGAGLASTRSRLMSPLMILHL